MVFLAITFLLRCHDFGCHGLLLFLYELLSVTTDLSVERQVSYVIHCIGGSKGGARDARPPWGSKFFHFHAVFGKNVKNNSNFRS